MTTLSTAFADGRAQRRTRRRAAVLASLVAGTAAVLRFLGRRLPSYRQARSAVLRIGGLSALVYAAFQWNMIAGFVAVGVSLLLLEAVGDDDA